MIDFVKCYFNDVRKITKSIENNPRIASEYAYSQSYKDVVTVRYKYYNLEFAITDHSCYFKGSLHSLYNALDGRDAKNYTDFGVNELLYILDHLESLLDYDFKDTRLTVAEYGYNIELQENVTDFIRNNVSMYKYKLPCSDPKNKLDMTIMKYEYQDYVLKIYDKGKQFKLNKNILRVELHNKKKELRRFNIFSINDLRNPESIQIFHNKLIDRLQDLLIIDSYKGNNSMPKEIKNLMIEYTHADYWIELRTKKNYNKISKSNKELMKIIEKYNVDSKKKLLMSQITDKYNILKVRNSSNVLYGISNIWGHQQYKESKV